MRYLAIVATTLFVGACATQSGQLEDYPPDPAGSTFTPGAEKSALAGPDSVQHCESILKGNIYNTQATDYSYLDYERFFNNVCSYTHSEKSEFKDFMGSLSIPIAKAVPLGINLSGSDSDFRKSLQKMCKTRDSREFHQGEYSSRVKEISGLMVNAYKSCIDTIKASRTGFFAFAKPAEMGNYETFIIDLTFEDEERARDGVITSIEGSKNIKCVHDGQEIKTEGGFFGKGYSFGEKRNVAITCTKYADHRMAMAINTKDHGTAEVILPGRRQAEVRRLSHQLNIMEDFVAQNLVPALEKESRRRIDCQVKPTEDFEGYARCPSGHYEVDRWCDGDCSGDDAKAVMCCEVPPGVNLLD